MQPKHWPAVRAIYLEGIADGHATFETAAPEWEQWDAGHLEDGRLVAECDGSTVAWAALSPVSRRAAYRGVAEVSIYVARAFRGRGVGSMLLRSVVENAESAGIWTLQASVFPENEATLRLHASAGFRHVGVREKIGQLHGVWRDTVLLERRSTRVGFVCALLLCVAGACGGPGGQDRRGDEVPVVAFDTGSVFIATAGDTVRVRVEIAQREEQRRHGLMERQQLAEDAGMLFLYDDVQPAGSGFWMFRTRLPLDIAFLDEDGRILSILQMAPCESPNPQFCPSYAPDTAYRYALEVNAGFFARQGIHAGDRVLLDALPGR